MELKEYCFKELLSRIVDNRGKTCPTAEEGTALIATNCIKNDELYPVFEKVRWVDQATMENWFRGHPEPGDILFVTKGSPGRCCLVPNPVNFCIAQDMLALRADETKVSQRFLFALLRSSIVQNAIVNLYVGTLIPHFKKGDFDQLFLSIPESKNVQNKIGDIYFTLSDKIELNRRMNATLEGMAQALFKSWFVDFDPVLDNAIAAGNPIPEELAKRAKLRRQALADGTANREAAKQFPATFQLTEEMGWIPEGWEVRSVGECFRLLGGHSFKSGDYIEDGLYGVVTIKNVQGGSFVQDCSNRITALPKKMKDHCLLNTGDVLLSLTGNVGRVCIVSDGSYVLNQRVSKIVGIDQIPEAFSYFYFRQKPLYERMITIAKGTAQQNLSPIETAKLEQAMPNHQTIRTLSTILDSYYQKMIGNISVNQTLTKLRETLLPKLISGELRLPDAEKLAEAAIS
jgi:type I restriction enzyme S subunit